jgi:hypothetical protein
MIAQQIDYNYLIQQTSAPANRLLQILPKILYFIFLTLALVTKFISLRGASENPFQSKNSNQPTDKSTTNYRNAVKKCVQTPTSRPIRASARRRIISTPSSFKL